MSEPSIARFPRNPLSGHDNDAHAAHKARQRIAELPDPYLEHATPAKEHLIGAVKAVSPAASGNHVQGYDEVRPRAAQSAAMPAPEVAGASSNPLATPNDTAVTGGGEAPRPPKSRLSWWVRLRPIFIGLATFVVLYFIFKPELLLSQLNYLTHPKSSDSAPAVQATATVPPDPTISIPKINVNAPVVYATSNDENAILADLQNGVVHYANTALPGQAGNSVIFGHSSNDWWEPGNFKFVFVLLDKLVPGDTFTVNYNSHQYLYQVTSSTVVDPTDVAVLNQTPDPEMTLITCSPPGTSWKRLVVVAKQISPAPTAAKAAPAKQQNAGTLPSNSPSLTDDIKAWWQNIKGFFGGTKSSTDTPASTTPTNTGTIPAVQ